MIQNQTKNCNACHEDLKAYVDRELPAWRRWTIEQHLTRCSHCQQELKELEELTNQMKAMDNSRNLSAAFRERLVGAMQEKGKEERGNREEGTGKRLPLWREKPFAVFGIGGATVAASLIVFAALYNPAMQTKEEAVAVSVAQPMAAPAATGSATMMHAQDYDVAQPATALPFKGQTGTTTMTTTTEEMKRQRSVAGEAAYGGDLRAAESGAYDVSTVPAVDERQVHRTATLGVAVESVEATSNKVEEMVKASNGYVASNNLTTDASGFKSAQVTVKVPEETFDKMMTDIAKLGDVRFKNVTGEDITEQMSDATSDEQVLVDEVQKLDDRVKNGGMSEKRTAQTEAELRQVRLQLARTRARLGLLRKMARLSTLDVTLTEKAQATLEKPVETGWLHDLQETNHAAMTAFQAAVRVPVVLIVWILAFSPLWVPLLLAYRWAERRREQANR